MSKRIQYGQFRWEYIPAVNGYNWLEMQFLRGKWELVCQVRANRITYAVTRLAEGKNPNC